MHFGVQAAVHALTCMQLLGASDGSKNEEQQQRASFFLQQLHEHLEAISTPGRRVCLLDSTFGYMMMSYLSRHICSVI